MSSESTDPDPDATESWDAWYSGEDQIWSGRVNAVLAEVADGLPVGTVLDLGCGEGADAVWLAERGWRVTAVDVAETALARTRAAAAAGGVASQITTEQHDLTFSFPDDRFDLVSAQYLHSTQDFPRTTVLQRAAQAVTPGGRLFIVDHGAAPPWMPDDHEHPDFPPVRETFDSLQLGTDNWQVERLETSRREGRGPSGEVGELLDNVILARRVG